MDDRCHDCQHKIDCLLGEDLCDNAQYWLDQVQNNPLYNEDVEYDKDLDDWFDDEEDDED